jgi:hypothetical protein
VQFPYKIARLFCRREAPECAEIYGIMCDCARYVQSIFDRGTVPYGAPEPNPEAPLATMYDASTIGPENHGEVQKIRRIAQREIIRASSYSPTPGHDLAVSDGAER